ncbi:MAG TPA: glycosyltransferase family A protein [Ignavibacteria bacterium]|nr:glycosyltransferase family A protein [Ignavibacteria bacterium]
MNNPLISILIVTHNRKGFFVKCLDAVIRTTSDIDREIIIWDNCSTDGTAEIIKEYAATHGFIRYNISESNDGVNGKSKAFEMARGSGYIACLDDDVIELPEKWAERMMRAFFLEPELGYLALDVVQNEHTTGAKYPAESYTEKKYPDDITLQFGPVGGWAFMIPRIVYERVGRLRIMRNKIFFAEDGDYITRCANKGYTNAILKDVKCFHATGPYYNADYSEVFDKKMKDFEKGDVDLHRIKRGIQSLYRRALKKLFGKNR